MSISRRTFVKGATAVGAVVGFPTVIPSTALGNDAKAAPSERVGVAVIGCGGRGGYAWTYNKNKHAQIVAVCDPMGDRRVAWSKRAGNCAASADFREILAMPEVDAVHVATPDHWHVPLSLAAARAGKDIYCEKPLGVSVDEDLAAREITDKHKRMFQYGTQNRSMQQARLGIQLALNGHIGAVKELYVWCSPGAKGGSATPVLPVPADVDYNMWLGPAPEQPYCRDRCRPPGVYHIYDYAIGYLGGWGAHPLDMAQWWLDSAGYTVPVKYEGTGTIPTRGLYNTVTHWDMTLTYADGLKMQFMDATTARKDARVPHIGEIRLNADHACLLIGEEGWIAVGRGAWKVYPQTLYKAAREPGDILLHESREHAGDFINSVRTRKQPVGPLGAAVRSDLISNLCNICIRTGRPLQWDPKREIIVGDEDAVKLMSRPNRDWTKGMAAG